MLGQELLDPHEALTAIDPDWEMRFGADNEYEVVTMGDGSRSAVPRR
jgi:hypothetical protein